METFKMIMFVIKWMLLLSVVFIGIMIALQNYPLYFAWGWMIVMVSFLLWTRKFFN